MQETFVEVLDKVKNLLKKTVENGSSVEESATAARIAQQLIVKYRLDVNEVGGSDEEINDKHDPLFTGQRVIHWKSYLAHSIALINNCTTFSWKTRGFNGVRSLSYKIVGRKTDVEFVRWLFDYTSDEIEKLCQQSMKNGDGSGKTFSNCFKTGAVETIVERLNDGKTAAVEQSSNSQAMVLLNKRGEDVEKWVATNLKLKKPQTSYIRVNPDGFDLGREAGKKINLNKPLKDKN